MSSHPDTFSSGEAWFTEDGPESDIVLSTRIRLARNLADFTFPSTLKPDDAERVQALVFDAFSHIDFPERYQCVHPNNLDFSSKQILGERGILPEKDFNQRNINHVFQDGLKTFPCSTGLVIRTDGRLSCLINCQDHIHISSFASGYNPHILWNNCKEIDVFLQKHLQFAASYDFGFLTSAINESGSGMCISIRALLPGLLQQRKLKEIFDLVIQKNCTIKPALGGTTLPFGALGSCYQISTNSSFSGNEEDQITEFTALLHLISTQEKEARQYLFENKNTILKHIIYRMYAIARYSRFLDCSEAIDILSTLHLGVSLKVIQGISKNELHAMMYRIRNAHVDFLRKTGNFSFEKDVEQDISLMIARLRAVLIQELVENIQICF